MVTCELPPLHGPGSNANGLMTWLQARPPEELVIAAQAIFDNILDIASQPRSATKDACVKLCGFVQLCVKSQHDPLRKWAFREQTAKDLFDYYLNWNEKDQHRSMRLALDVVCILVLQNPTAHVRESLEAEFLSVVVQVITKKSTRPVVKSSISALTRFLAKSVLALDDLARQYVALCPDLAAEPTIALWQDLVAELFTWMQLHHICPVAGKCLVLIFSMLYAHVGQEASEATSTASFSLGVLRTSLETALSTDPDMLESVKNYILAPLFKADRKLSRALLGELSKSVPDGQRGSSGGDVTALLHLAALEVGRKYSLVDDPSPTGAAPPKDTVILDRQVLEPFLGHTSHAVRSFAVSLLITSSSTTKPYAPMTFELLRRHLRSFHADPDAKFRSEVLQHSKNMVKRILIAISVMQRDIGRLTAKQSQIGDDEDSVYRHIRPSAKHIVNAGEKWLRESLQAHEVFFGWYLNFLLEELVPTGSYQRHITALKSLVNTVKLGKEHPGSAEKRVYHDPQWLRTILDLVMDPFDDVRGTASGLLMLFPADAVRIKTIYGADQPSVTSLDILAAFCAKAGDLASRTSRADHSDGAARSLGLLCAWQETLVERLALFSRTLDELEQNITMAEQDLSHAVMTTPVHGTFAAIRYMWEMLSQRLHTDEELHLFAKPQTRIVDLCTRIWNAVSCVLCDDSPEGHLPEELEELEGFDTKGLLSYSFRAIHESSTLLRTIVGNLRASRAGSLLPGPDVFRAAGNLAFNQLSTLRHRGAFSSVSLTFTCCCQNAQHPSVISSVENRSLLETWYQGTLSCINTQRSTTRRSAGIPCLITGILSSFAEQPSFQEIIRALQSIATEPARIAETDASNLPQVHAFNCLKEVFKSAVLSKHAELYLSECLQLATTNLKSEVWAIRNCALILLRSLMDMLLGTAESKSTQETGWDGKTLRLSYTKYSALPQILLNLLQSGDQAMKPGTLTQSSAAESVFPALEIIRRAGPPECNRDGLYIYITKYLGSRQWHVREMAARTLCSFLVTGDWREATRSLLQESRGSANKLHGTLLTIKFFLERRLTELSGENTLVGLRDLHSAVQSFEGHALMCSETAAAYFEIINLLWEATASEQSTTSDSSLANVLSKRRKTCRFTTVALLNNRSGTLALRKAAMSGDLGALKTCLLDALDEDIDTACALLEATPSVWGQVETAALCRLYLEVCNYTKVPEARAAVLTNLAELMDATIASGNLQALPPAADLDAFQLALHDTVNPALANALLRASGPILARHALQHHGQPSFLGFEQRLRAWGKALADALHVSNTFDTRLAAATALRSLAAALHRARAAVADAAYLPVLLALYAALVDDDEAIRAVGAAAAAFAVAAAEKEDEHKDASAPRPLVPVDAADALLAWLQARFGRTHELRAYAVCRLVGDSLVAVDLGVQDLAAWPPAAAQLAAALEVDESLFAVEAQNLFVDEVRETERWAAVLLGAAAAAAAACCFDDDGGDGAMRREKRERMLREDAALAALAGWTAPALAVLAAQVAAPPADGDGPLGWASRPRAFALAHRVLVCGRVLAALFGDGDIEEEEKEAEEKEAEEKEAEEGGGIRTPTPMAALRARIRAAGRRARLHGLLLAALGA